MEFCIPCQTVSFTLRKFNSITGAPVAGAGFTLYQDGQPVAGSTTSQNGVLAFDCIKPGFYELIETAVPDGFLPYTPRHQVQVNRDLTVLIDGIAPECFLLTNTPAAITGRFSFFKTDGEGRPLSSAVFILSIGAMAVSGEDGLVDFGSLPPGTYTMTETSAPNGYSPSDTQYTVVVSANGSISVNGISLESFTAVNNPNIL